MQVLSTKILSKSDVSYAESFGVTVNCVPFIATKQITIAESERQYFLDKQYELFIITSAYAGAFLQYILSDDRMPRPKEIYAVGEKTTKFLIGMDDITHYPNESNAESLSKLILNEASEKYCCYLKGNISLGTIEEELAYSNIKVEPFVCYNTELFPQSIEMEKYDGVMFFSPSAVESFMKGGNEIGRKPIFAIGKTTAKAVKDILSEDAIVAPCANTKSLIETIKEYSNENK